MASLGSSAPGVVDGILSDRSWKGTTKQFVLHFNEQFRQLDELTLLDEQLTHPVRLTLLQSAVRSVPELRIVENNEEYMCLTNSHFPYYSITYDKYFTMLQKACIRYDKHLKHKPSSTARIVYQHDFDGNSDRDDNDGDYVDEGFAPDGIDTPSDDFYNIHTTNFNRNPQVKSLIPRSPPGKSKPKGPINKPWYNG